MAFFIFDDESPPVRTCDMSSDPVDSLSEKLAMVSVERLWETKVHHKQHPVKKNVMARL